MPPARPALPDHIRIEVIDMVRGIAVIGIVLMNIFVFAMPAAAYYNPLAYGGTDAASMTLWAVSFVLVEDKMRTLFAMLFGVSTLLMLGQGSARRHYARMGWLLLIGIVHATLLASNDILRLYALCGLVLPVFASLSVRGLWQAAVALLALHMIVGGGLAVTWTTEYLSFTGPTVVSGPLAQIERMFGAVPDVAAAQRALMTGPYGEFVAWRFNNMLRPLIAAVALLPVTLSAMLAGMALFRGGLFAGEWTDVRLRRWAWLGAVIGLPPLCALAAWAFANHFASVIIAGNAVIWSAPFDLALGIAFAALAVLWLRGYDNTAIAERLAATGRMALSNYLATSTILALIFYGSGLGLWGTVGRVALYGYAAIPIAMMLLWSRPWLTRFRFGPAEWLWRSLVEWQAVPLRSGAYERR